MAAASTLRKPHPSFEGAGAGVLQAGQNGESGGSLDTSIRGEYAGLTSYDHLERCSSCFHEKVAFVKADVA
jgi:hypothetical protein